MAHILVIEDEINVRETIEEILRLKGYSVAVAQNGREGVMLAIEHPPDCIICDVMMPVMDGFEVLATIRRHETLANTPFLFLTAKVERASIRSGMQLGADDYLTKPFSYTELIEAIETRLARASTQREEVQRRFRDLQTVYERAEMHEVNTPLNGILGGVDLLLHCWKTLTEEERVELLELIRMSGRRLHRTMSNYFLYKEIMQQDDGAESGVALHSSVSAAVEIIRDVARECAFNYARVDDIIFHLGDAPPLLMNREQLEKIIFEILDNALKFSAAGTEIHLDGSITEDGYLLSIMDLGRGMTAEQISEIAPFRQFDRGRHEQQGNGLGLYITQRLIAKVGGTMSLTPNTPNGLQVVLRFPAA